MHKFRSGLIIFGTLVVMGMFEFLGFHCAFIICHNPEEIGIFSIRGFGSSAGHVFLVYISILVDISTCSDANSLAVHGSI